MSILIPDQRSDSPADHRYTIYDTIETARPLLQSPQTKFGGTACAKSCSYIPYFVFENNICINKKWIKMKISKVYETWCQADEPIQSGSSISANLAWKETRPLVGGRSNQNCSHIIPSGGCLKIYPPDKIIKVIMCFVSFSFTFLHFIFLHFFAFYFFCLALCAETRPLTVTLIP